jgi:hypothetical protein
LYVALRGRYSHNLHNNGKIFLSQRTAAKELASHHNEIARWFRELQHYRFIVMTTPGCLGVEGKGKAPRWRLTELGYMGEPPTRDFMHWDGTPFKNKKIKPRAGKPARSVQEKMHTHVQENQHPDAGAVRGIGAQCHTKGCAAKPAQNYITTRLPITAPPTDATATRSLNKRVRLRLKD